MVRASRLGSRSAERWRSGCSGAVERDEAPGGSSASSRPTLQPRRVGRVAPASRPPRGRCFGRPRLGAQLWPAAVAPCRLRPRALAVGSPCTPALLARDSAAGWRFPTVMKAAGSDQAAQNVAIAVRQGRMGPLRVGWCAFERFPGGCWRLGAMRLEWGRSQISATPASGTEVNATLDVCFLAVCNMRRKSRRPRGY